MAITRSLLSGISQRQLARLNRFRVQIGIPPVMQARLSDYKPFRFINAACTAFPMPAHQLGTFEKRAANGPLYQFPNDKIYNDVTAQFLNDSKHNERRFFLDWLESINDGQSNHFEFYENYVSNINVIQLDMAQLPTAGVTLVEAYPTQVSEIAYSYETENTLATFSVTFNFRTILPFNPEGSIVQSMLDIFGLTT